MIIIVEVLFSIALIVFGYLSSCLYLNKLKIKEIKKEHLRISKNKIIYLLFSCVTFTSLILSFNLIYKLDLLTQIKLLTLIGVLLPCAAVDYKTQKIPNILIICGIIIRVVLLIVEFIANKADAVDSLKDSVLGALTIGAFFFLLMIIFKNSIGMGDVKLFFVMGLFQGLWGVACSVFMAFAVTFFISIFLLVTKKKGKKDSISFGPSILIGTIISMCLSGM